MLDSRLFSEMSYFWRWVSFPSRNRFGGCGGWRRSAVLAAVVARLGLNPICKLILRCPRDKNFEARSPRHVEPKFRGEAGSELVWELCANLISSTLPLKLTSGAGNGINGFS